MYSKIKISTIVILASVVLSGFLASSVLANDLTRLREERQNAQQQQRNARAALEEVRETHNETLIAIAEKDAEMEELTIEYFAVLDDLEFVTYLLYNTEHALAAAEVRRSEQHEALRSRIRFMHENSSFSYIEMLFASANITDFLNNIEHVTQMIEYDNYILENLRATEMFIAERRDEAYIRRLEVEMLTQELSVRRYALEESLAASYAFALSLEADEVSYMQLAETWRIAELDIHQRVLTAERAHAEEQARTAQARAAAQAPLVIEGGRMAWPVAGTQRVNSQYGNRTHPISGRREFHTGIDLRAPHGTNILAAERGIVTLSRWWGGYGNTIVIDHGGGLTTLYAHNSVNLVRVGDTVERGQVIARAGATGTATGSHLHFEVQRNGQHVDPNPYLGIRR